MDISSIISPETQTRFYGFAETAAGYVPCYNNLDKCKEIAEWCYDKPDQCVGSTVRKGIKAGVNALPYNMAISLLSFHEKTFIYDVEDYNALSGTYGNPQFSIRLPILKYYIPSALSRISWLIKRTFVTSAAYGAKTSIGAVIQENVPKETVADKLGVSLSTVENTYKVIDGLSSIPASFVTRHTCIFPELIGSSYAQLGADLQKNSNINGTEQLTVERPGNIGAGLSLVGFGLAGIVYAVQLTESEKKKDVILGTALGILGLGSMITGAAVSCGYNLSIN